MLKLSVIGICTLALKGPIVGKNHSLVAITNMCGECINYGYISEVRGGGRLIFSIS
jgi:hypothetical protein